jgi:hypothetical protein
LHFAAGRFNLNVPFGKARLMADEKKFDAFRPQEPKIPGVPDSASRPARPAPPPPKPLVPPPLPKRKVEEKTEHMPMLWVVGIVAACLVCVIVAWWSHHVSAKEEIAAAPTADVTLPTATAEAPKPEAKLPSGPGEVATAKELEKPWSSQKFIFQNPITSERSPAMVVRLPGGVLWGFSLREPFGTCEMEYVTDTSRIEREFKYRAQHPMVVDPCNRAVFDLTDYGSGPNGPVRGAIVAGAAVRPPIAIEMSTKGNEVVAVRIE